MKYLRKILKYTFYLFTIFILSGIFIGWQKQKLEQKLTELGYTSHIMMPTQTMACPNKGIFFLSFIGYNKDQKIEQGVFCFKISKLEFVINNKLVDNSVIDILDQKLKQSHDHGN